MENRAVYPIGIVAETLDVHPETLRVWEKFGIIKPKRRSGRRHYSEADMKRLKFIQRLMAENLNIPAIRYYLQLYPCWQHDSCPVCMHRSDLAVCAKPCWQEPDKYCQMYGSEDACLSCEYRREVTVES